MIAAAAAANLISSATLGCRSCALPCTLPLTELLSSLPFPSQLCLLAAQPLYGSCQPLPGRSALRFPPLAVLPPQPGQTLGAGLQKQRGAGE